MAVAGASVRGSRGDVRTAGEGVCPLTRWGAAFEWVYVGRRGHMFVRQTMRWHGGDVRRHLVRQVRRLDRHAVPRGESRP